MHIVRIIFLNKNWSIEFILLDQSWTNNHHGIPWIKLFSNLKWSHRRFLEDLLFFIYEINMNIWSAALVINVKFRLRSWRYFWEWNRVKLRSIPLQPNLQAKNSQYYFQLSAKMFFQKCDFCIKLVYLFFFQGMKWTKNIF